MLARLPCVVLFTQENLQETRQGRGLAEQFKAVMSTAGQAARLGEAERSAGQSKAKSSAERGRGSAAKHGARQRGRTLGQEGSSAGLQAGHVSTGKGRAGKGRERQG